jgi:predicted Zn-dependent peptidase
MIDTFYGTFPNQGYVQATLQPEELAPIQLEIDKIQKEIISEKDYQKIQNNLENINVSSLGSVSGISQSLASYHNIHGDASMINKISEILRSISREEIKAAANKYLDKNQRLIMEYLPETKE